MGTGVDLLIHGDVVVTMDAGRTIIDDGAVVVDAGRIVAVTTVEQARRQFDPIETVARDLGLLE